MTREELIERICPTDNISECGSVECNFCCDDCNNMLECMLLEYEKQIREKTIDEFTQAFKDYVYTETLRGNKPYWTVGIKKVAEQLKGE